ncbi:40S ribosomal protein S25 [Claviceps citrina]|nr:40S ribosomal protein S25 [Claviceps citrina]
MVSGQPTARWALSSAKVQCLWLQLSWREKTPLLHTPLQRQAHQNKMAPAAGAKKQKKKWSKGKVKDKAQHAVLLDKTTSEKLYKDVQSYRLVTVAVLVDRMKVNGSLARQCIKDLEEKGLIKPVVSHSKMKIYTRAVGGS